MHAGDIDEAYLADLEESSRGSKKNRAGAPASLHGVGAFGFSCMRLMSFLLCGHVLNDGMRPRLLPIQLLSWGAQVFRGQVLIKYLMST